MIEIKTDEDMLMGQRAFIDPETGLLRLCRRKTIGFVVITGNIKKGEITEINCWNRARGKGQ